MWCSQAWWDTSQAFPGQKAQLNGQKWTNNNTEGTSERQDSISCWQFKQLEVSWLTWAAVGSNESRRTVTGPGPGVTATAVDAAASGLAVWPKSPRSTSWRQTITTRRKEAFKKEEGPLLLLLLLLWCDRFFFALFCSEETADMWLFWGYLKQLLQSTLKNKLKNTWTWEKNFFTYIQLNFWLEWKSVWAHPHLRSSQRDP